MTINALPVRNELVATTGQTIFNYTFKIYTINDLNVYVTPTGQEANDSTDLTTAYIVDPGGIDNEDGGFITLNVATSSNDLVTIVSSIVENRTTDYQNSGDFLPDTVNADFDRTVSIAKQTDDRSGRTLAFQESLQGATALDLPNPSALQFMRWKSDESGMENVDLTVSGTPTNANIITYSAGNNFTGGADRSQENKNIDVISPKDFDAVGDGETDDTAAFNRMFAYLKNVGLDPTVLGSLDGIAQTRVDMGGDTYLISSELNFDEMYYVTFSNGEFLADSGAVWGSNNLLSLRAPQATDVFREQRIRNIAFEGIKVNGSYVVAVCVNLENTFKVSFDAACFITGWVDGGIGIKTSNASGTPVTKNTHFTLIGTEVAQNELSYNQAGAGSPHNTGTAISVQTADFIFTGVTVWGADVGFFFNGFFNGQMNDCHAFVKSAQECLVIGDNCSGIQVSNFYSDTGIVTIKSFSHTFTGGSFAANSQVNLEAQSANETGKGLIITGAIFSKNIAFTTAGPGTWETDKKLSLNGCRKRDTGQHIELAGIDSMGAGRLGIVSGNAIQWVFEDDQSLQPVGNGTQDFGAAEKRLAAIYVNIIRLNEDNAKIVRGNGTPEGNQTADVGSTYHRLDGGAGTSFYVKESGMDTNTGWIAK